MKKVLIGVVIGFLLGSTLFAYAASYIVEDATFPIWVNGKEFKSDKPIVTINSSTYIPLKAIGEALNIKVNWNSTLNRVEIGESVPVTEQYSFSKPAPLNTLQTIA